MKKSFLNSVILLMLTACAVKIEPINNNLVVGSVRGPFNLPHIYAIRSDGKEVNTNLPFNLGSQPEWSQDHLWIVFTTDNPNRTEIYIIGSDGSNRTQLTDFHNGESYDPAWSPRGNRITYFSYDKYGNQDGIYIMDLSCILEKVKCSFVPRFLIGGYSPSWSPDGQKIVFQTLDNQIAILNIVQASNPIILIADKNCRKPKWSPSGEKIAVGCFEENNLDVFSIDVDGSNFTNLTNGIGTNTKPVWSPDGTKIAFISDRDTTGTMLGFNDTVRSNSVYVMDSDGTNVKRITTYNNESVLWLTWVYP